MQHRHAPFTSFTEMPQKNRPDASRQTGSATVEFGLLLPMLVLILMGIVEFGLALYDKSVITNAGREGARSGVVLRAPAVTEEEIRARVLAYAGNSLIGLGPASSVTVEFPVQTDANQLAVRVNYTFQGLALGRMLSAMDTPLVLSTTTVMARE
jgi:Flp pilus assembly protein TadG